MRAGPALVRPLLLTLLATSCSGDGFRTDPSSDPAVPNPGPVTGQPAVELYLVASSVDPAVGNRVSVAVRNVSTEVLAALQAGVDYDASALRFLGAAAPESPSGPVVTHEPSPGRVQISVVAPAGVPEDGIVLVFEVLREMGLPSLRLVVTDAVAAVRPLLPRPVRVAETGLRVDSTLTLEPVVLDAAGWQAKLGWAAASSPALPRVITGEIYGDVNASGVINVSDVVLVQLVSLGAQPPFTGNTFEVANVAPANVADGVEATLPDVCRPGRVCTTSAPYAEVGPGVVNVLDAATIALESLGLPQLVVGSPVPAAPLPGPAVRLSRLLPGYFFSSAFAINDAGTVVGIVDNTFGLNDPLIQGAKPMAWPVDGGATLLERPSPLPPGEVELPYLNAGSEAIAINNSGLIVVKVAYPFVSYLVSGASATFFSTDVYPRSASNDLGAAPSRAMNGAGEFIATCRPTPDAQLRNAACVVNALSGAQRLLPGMPDKAGALPDRELGINENGDVTGFYAARDGSQVRNRGIVWLRSQAPQVLAPLPGDNCSIGWGINSAKDVVGVSGACTVEPLVPTGQTDTLYFGGPTIMSGTRPVIWKSAEGYLAHALALPPGGQTFAAANAINDRGVIIGGMSRSNGSVPVFWINEVPYSLEALGGLQGCTYSSGFGPSGYAMAINEQNQVAGECAGRAAVWDITIPASVPPASPSVAKARQR